MRSNDWTASLFAVDIGLIALAGTEVLYFYKKTACARKMALSGQALGVFRHLFTVPG